MAFKDEDIYSLDDKMAVYLAIKEHSGERVTQAQIARESGIRETIVRFIVRLLINWGYVEKRCVVDMGPHYKRYAYFTTDKDYAVDKYQEQPWKEKGKKEMIKGNAYYKAETNN